MSARCGSSHGGSLSDRPSTASFAEVDRLEVTAIAYFRHLAAELNQLLAEPKLFVLARDRHRHVMDGAKPVDRRLRVRVVDDVDGAAWRISLDGDANPFLCFIDDDVAQQAGHQLQRSGRITNGNRYAVKAADGIIQRDAAGAPRHACIAGGRDQLED